MITNEGMVGGVGGIKVKGMPSRGFDRVGSSGRWISSVDEGG